MEGLKEMVSLYDDAVDHGVDLGMEKERVASLDRSIESIVNLVRDFGLSFEQASSALVIPEEDRAKVEAEAKKKLSGDEELEGLKEMVSLYDDAVHHGREAEKAISTEMVASGIVSMIEKKDMTFEEAISMFTIPEDRMPEIKAEVRKRMKSS